MLGRSPGMGVERAGGTLPYYMKLKNTQPTSLIQYLRAIETAGATAVDSSPEANNGAYSGTGLVLANALGPHADGNNAPYFDGANSRINLDSVPFRSDFNGQELTISAWVKVSAAGDWTDSAYRSVCILLVDANNYLQITKNNTNNALRFFYKAGGTSKDVTGAYGGQTTWIHVCMTVSRTAGEMKAYVNGVQVGTTQAIATNWAGALPGTRSNIGCNTGVTNEVWKGWIADVAIWKTALTPTEVGTLANP